MMTTIYPWINFALFIGALFYFLREPLNDFLGDRRESLRKELDDLTHQRGQLELQFQGYRKKMNEAGQEIKKMIDELRKEGEFEKQTLIKKSQGFAQKIKDDAGKMGLQELAKAKIKLKQKTLLLALELAKAQLQKTINANDQERLGLWAIKHLEGFESERPELS